LQEAQIEMQIADKKERRRIREHTKPSRACASYTNDYFLVPESTPSSTINLADNESETTNFMHVKAMKIHWVDKVLIAVGNYQQRCTHSASHQIMIFWTRNFQSARVRKYAYRLTQMNSGCVNRAANQLLRNFVA
jgi:hypothetical protein